MGVWVLDSEVGVGGSVGVGTVRWVWVGVWVLDSEVGVGGSVGVGQ